MDNFIISEYEDHQKLTGVICLMLAAKSEDIDDSVPSVKDTLQMFNLEDDLGYDMRFEHDLNPQELSLIYRHFSLMWAKLEFLIFECIGFNTIRPVVPSFINIFQALLVSDEDVSDIGNDPVQKSFESLQMVSNIYLKQFLDIIIHTTAFFNVPPSLLAAAIIGSVRKLLKIQSFWNDNLTILTSYSRIDILPLMSKLMEIRTESDYDIEDEVNFESVLKESGYLSEVFSEPDIDEEMEPPVTKKRKSNPLPEMIYAVL